MGLKRPRREVRMDILVSEIDDPPPPPTIGERPYTHLPTAAILAMPLSPKTYGSLHHQCRQFVMPHIPYCIPYCSAEFSQKNVACVLTKTDSFHYSFTRFVWQQYGHYTSAHLILGNAFWTAQWKKLPSHPTWKDECCTEIQFILFELESYLSLAKQKQTSPEVSLMDIQLIILYATNTTKSRFESTSMSTQSQSGSTTANPEGPHCENLSPSPIPRSWVFRNLLTFSYAHSP